MSELFFLYTLVVVLLILFPLVHYGEKLYRKKYIECYRQTLKDGKPVIDGKMEALGEFIKIKDLVSREGYYELIFKKGSKKYSVFSPVSMDEYLSHWLIKKYLVVMYLMDAYTFSEKLEIPETRKLNYTYSWRLYFWFKKVFYLDIQGTCLSSLFVGLFTSAFYNFSFESLLMGCLIGIIMSTINTFLFKQGIIKPMKTVERMEKRTYLIPIESKYELVDIYEATYEERIKQETGDKANQYEWRKKKCESVRDKFVKDNYMKYFGKEKEIEDPHVIIIEGFGALQDLLLDKNIRNLNYKKKRVQEFLRTVPEMKSNRREFLSRNSYLWKQIMDGRKTNGRLQESIRNYQRQIVTLEETKDIESKELITKFLLEKQAYRGTLKDLMSELYGAQLVNKKFDEALKDCIRVIEQEREVKLTDSIRDILHLLHKVMDKLSNVSGIDFTDLKSILDIGDKEMLPSEL